MQNCARSRFGVRRWIGVSAILVGLGLGGMQATSASNGPDDLLVAFAFDPTTTVQLLQAPDFATGEIITTLGVFQFDPLVGLFFSGQVVLNADQFTFSSRDASVVGPIDLVVSAFDPCSGAFSEKQVTVGDLSWTSFGPPSPTVVGFHGPDLFIFQRQLSREADATGMLTGDIDFDLANAEFASVGVIKSRFE